jgi:hypothetical protein
MEKPEKKKSNNRVQAIFDKMKSNPFTSLAIVFGVVVISIGSFTQAIVDIKDFFDSFAGIGSSDENVVYTNTLSPTLKTSDALPKTQILSTQMPTPLSSKTLQSSIQADKNLYDVSLEVDFDDISDLVYFDILSDGYSDEDIKIDQGKFFFGLPPIRALNLKPILAYRTAIHLRWKVVDKQTCYAFPFWVRMDNSDVSEIFEVGLGSCSYHALGLEYQNKSEEFSILDDAYNPIVTNPDQWIEAVLWIEDNPQMEFRALAWDSDAPAHYSIYRAAIPEWEGEKQFGFSFNGFEGEIAIDYLKIINGEVESYLWFNAPPFTVKSDSILGYFNSEE